MPQTNDIDFRSEHVYDILNKVPNWMIRWGNTLIFLIILAVLLFSSFIRYPDIVSNPIVITTQRPPENLVAKTNGKVVEILVKDKAKVKKNTPLAIIENSANYKDVFILKNNLDSVKINSATIRSYTCNLSLLQLGEIQSAYSVFEKDMEAYRINSVLQPYGNEKSSQSLETIQLLSRLQLVKQQKENTELELKLKRKELERYNTLLQKKVIAVQEFETKNIEYLQMANNFKSLQSQQSQLASSINELRKNTKSTVINETKDNAVLFRNVLHSYSLLRKAIYDWELAYVFRSSIDGQVSFMQVRDKNQTINAGETVFTIVPNGKVDYIGRVKAKAFNAGKLKIGQNVNIRLLNYPDREFGIVKGQVKSISLVPDKEGDFLVDVALPQGLATSYRKKIVFQHQMQGTADVITEDLSLLERLLYQFRGVLGDNK